MYTHHSSYSLDGARLLNIGKKIAIDMKKLIDTEHRVALAFRGLSGTALASVVLAETERLNGVLGAIYVRKPGEESHGSSIEYGIPWDIVKLTTIIFIDDFIETGETLYEVYETITSDFEAMKELYDIPNDDFHHLKWGLCTAEDEPPIGVCISGFDTSFVEYRFGPYI